MNKFEKLLGTEYRFLDEDARLGDNIHLLVYGGSKAYGTNLPTSDTDIRGIATNTAENILLGNDFEVFTNEATDTVIYSVDKIFGLLSSCNPNTIEILFVRDEDIIYMDDIGKMIRESRDIFLSNKCIGTFGGYANQQLYRLQQKTLSALSDEEYNKHIAKTIAGMNEHLIANYGLNPIEISSEKDGLYAHIKETTCSVDIFSNLLNEINNVIREYNKRSDRNEKALTHNKINKHAMHLVRLYLMAIELLTTGTVCTYRSVEHQLLMDIRTGKYSTENGQMNTEFFELVKELENSFDKAKMHSKLPDKPDFTAINELRALINWNTITFEKKKQRSLSEKESR